MYHLTLRVDQVFITAGALIALLGDQFKKQLHSRKQQTTMSTQIQNIVTTQDLIGGRDITETHATIDNDG
jgi:hypothetical protein